MIFSYSRVSTSDKGQTVANQDLLIEKAGFKIDRIFEDVGVSGSVPAQDRPAFKQMISEMKPSDTCVCISIDRLGRSALDVLRTVEYFKKHNLSLRILQLDSVDLTSSVGKLLLTMLAAVAEMEKSLLIERTKAGIARTVSEGTVLGKLEKLSPSALADIKHGKLTHAQYAEKYGVSTKSIQRAMKKCVVEYEKKFEKKIVQHKLRDSVVLN